MKNTTKCSAPKTLQEALQSGWKIDEELSSWGFGSATRREGFLFLKKRGQRRPVTVPFVAFYQTSRPYFTFGDRGRQTQANASLQ